MMQHGDYKAAGIVLAAVEDIRELLGLDLSPSLNPEGPISSTVNVLIQIDDHSLPLAEMRRRAIEVKALDTPTNPSLNQNQAP